jgi:hypothetical protein
MELDPVIKDLSTSALNLKPQESDQCAKRFSPSHKSLGILLVLLLVLLLMSQASICIWPSITPLFVLAITASTNPVFQRKRTKSK